MFAGCIPFSIFWVRSVSLLIPASISGCLHSLVKIFLLSSEPAMSFSPLHHSVLLFYPSSTFKVHFNYIGLTHVINDHFLISRSMSIMISSEPALSSKVTYSHVWELGYQSLQDSLLCLPHLYCIFLAIQLLWKLYPVLSSMRTNIGHCLSSAEDTFSQQRLFCFLLNFLVHQPDPLPTEFCCLELLRSQMLSQRGNRTGAWEAILLYLLRHFYNVCYNQQVFSLSYSKTSPSRSNLCSRHLCHGHCGVMEFFAFLMGLLPCKGIVCI